MNSLDEIKKHLDHNNETGKANTGFDVPEDYFSTLQNKILDQVAEEVVPRKINWFRMTAVAASICLLFTFVFLLQDGNLNNTDQDFAMAEEVEVSEEESLDFILNSDMDELTTDDFLELDGIDEILADLESELTNNNF